MTRRAWLVLLGALLVCGAGLTAPTSAGEKTSKRAKKKAHLDFKRSYAEALREARLRNLPVFVSRHKDF